MSWTIEPRCPVDELHQYAERWAYRGGAFPEALIEPVQRRGFLNREELLVVGKWKAERALGKLTTNTDVEVCESTRLAFGAETERLRIGCLLSLDGVGYPMASVLLHFFHADEYPILDRRALWAAGCDAGKTPHYTFDRWMGYVELCRQLSIRSGLSMRDVDKGLWQYSNEHQEGL